MELSSGSGIYICTMHGTYVYCVYSGIRLAGASGNKSSEGGQWLNFNASDRSQLIYGPLSWAPCSGDTASIVPGCYAGHNLRVSIRVPCRLTTADEFRNSSLSICMRVTVLALGQTSDDETPQMISG